MKRRIWAIEINANNSTGQGRELGEGAVVFRPSRSVDVAQGLKGDDTRATVGVE